MNSEEIKNGMIYANGISDANMTQAYWLKEIAYQLAVMNERAEKNQSGNAMCVALCATNDDIPVIVRQ